MSYYNDFHSKAWTNDSENVIRVSEYFEAEVREEDWEEALEMYHEWCKDNDETPEVDLETELEFVSESQLNHVIYHATFMGFEI